MRLTQCVHAACVPSSETVMVGHGRQTVTEWEPTPQPVHATTESPGPHATGLPPSVLPHVWPVHADASSLHDNTEQETHMSRKFPEGWHSRDARGLSPDAGWKTMKPHGSVWVSTSSPTSSGGHPEQCRYESLSVHGRSPHICESHAPPAHERTEHSVQWLA